MRGIIPHGYNHSFLLPVPRALQVHIEVIARRDNLLEISTITAGKLRNVITRPVSLNIQLQVCWIYTARRCAVDRDVERVRVEEEILGDDGRRTLGYRGASSPIKGVWF